jgi:beta-lactamase regulating signal transducer with metallopeptidase domain
MNTLDTLFPEGLTESLGSALFHSLWQAAAVGLILLLCILLIPRRHAQTRYVAGVLSILAMVVLPVITFFISYPENSTSITTAVEAPYTYHTAAGNVTATTPTPELSFQDEVMNWFQANQALMVALWVAGMAFFAIRFSGGYLLTRRLRRRGLGEVPTAWSHRLQQMAAQMRVGQPVQFHTSTRVSVPMVIGFLKPMILFPVGMLADLTPDQVELILAHELAHVRRYDYAVNLLLSLAQIVLFFHPAMWLASRFVRQERENCCDAIALRYHPDPARYARTLLTLETYRQRGLALSATGGSLSDRITRILNLRGKTNPVHFATAAILGLALVASVMASTYKDTPFMRGILGTEEAAGNVTLDDVVITASSDDASQPQDEYSWVLQDSEEVVVIILQDGKKTEIKMQDGEVVSVVEDGKTIAAAEYPAYRELALRTMENARNIAPPVIPSIAPVPPVPPAPVWREGDDQASFQRRMDAWEDEMEAWEESMQDWEERNADALSGMSELNCQGGLEELGIEMGRMGEDLAAALGDEQQWEEFGKAMERMAESLAKDFEGKKGDPGKWSKRDREAFERDMEQFGRDMEQWGEDFGRQMEDLMRQRADELEQHSDELRRQADEMERAADEEAANRQEYLENEEALESGFHFQTNSMEDIGNRLWEDGLTKSKTKFTFKLNQKGMWVDGVKMGDHIHEQYLPLLEELYGDAEEVSMVVNGKSRTLNVQ